jgi:hypothetical protein
MLDYYKHINGKFISFPVTKPLETLIVLSKIEYSVLIQYSQNLLL